MASIWGDLFEWSATSPKGAFSATDVSRSGAGPTRTVAGTPAAVFVQGQLSLFAAAVSVPSPEGTGVYSVPYAKWGQAIKDGWPILGVTGGLGAQCPPWTALSTQPGSTEPDEYVGDVIQASHLRETWLSFWTVSGPGTTPSGCPAERGPVTTRTFYLHGFLAGAFVANEIDGYRKDGLTLKPDWVLFDPEGYPDNNSGLPDPRRPPSKLSRRSPTGTRSSTAGAPGLASVDPSLKAGLYANQSEYMTYKLYSQPLPVFIAGAFPGTPGRSSSCRRASRSAPNIFGFIMFNTFAPTCAQVNNERLLLTRAPWNGDYNTIQIPAKEYCPPGSS